MAFLQHLFQLPYAPLWIPAMMLVAVGGGMFWGLRGMLHSHADSEPEPKPVTVPLETAGALPPKPKEHRFANRRKGNPVEVYLAVSADKDRPDLPRGYVLDRSVGGVRMTTFSAIAVGTVLSIRPVKAMEMVPWIDLDVRSCSPSTEMPGEFELGCQFVKTPPYSILLLFG